MTVLSIEHASASPWGRALLEDLNLTLESGQITGILGPNGAGKSSLLRLVAADFEPTQGSVLFHDRPVTAWSIQERARRIGVLPQLSLLNFPYLVEEVVLLGRTPHDTGSRLDHQILERVLELTDTVHLRQRLYTELSGGERQRVQLARVLSQVWQDDSLSGQLLLLDEPTTALDLAHQQQLLCILELLAERGCEVLVVLHDINLLAAIAQQVVVLDQGKQVDAGSPQSVLTETLFDRVFNTEVVVQSHPERGHPLVIPR